MDHLWCPPWWWDVGTHEPQALDLAGHVREVLGRPDHGPAETRLLSCLAEVWSGHRRSDTVGDPPGVRPVVVGLGGLPSLEPDELHQLVDEGWRQSGAGAASTTSIGCHTWVAVDPAPSQAGVA